MRKIKIVVIDNRPEKKNCPWLSNFSFSFMHSTIHHFRPRLHKTADMKVNQCPDLFSYFIKLRKMNARLTWPSFHKLFLGRSASENRSLLRSRYLGRHATLLPH